MKTCIHGDAGCWRSRWAPIVGRRREAYRPCTVPKTSQMSGVISPMRASVSGADDSRLSFDILIPPEDVMGARMGFVVGLTDLTSNLPLY